MITPCPQCKKQVEHEDFLFEVICDCGARFNPFMNMNEVPPLDGVEVAADPPTWQEPPAAPTNFAESQAVFAELKDFAEGNIAEAAPVDLNTALGNAPAAAFAAPPTPLRERPPAVPIAGDSEAILTSGDSLPGYRIDSYLPPISAVTELAPTPNPLRKGFDALWEEALALGANGVVAVRWVLSPDGSRVVLSGTPVRCAKEL